MGNVVAAFVLFLIFAQFLSSQTRGQNGEEKTARDDRACHKKRRKKWTRGEERWRLGISSKDDPSPSPSSLGLLLDFDVLSKMNISDPRSIYIIHSWGTEKAN